MKCSIPEISWHNRDPVLSIDIQVGNWKNSLDETFWRIVTGGADSHVLIWHLLINDTGGAIVSCVTDLERHQRAVNVVRFSPSGEILASADDESIIILWKQKEESELSSFLGEENSNKEQWTSWKVLKGHLEDIYDLCWSPDSSSLVSGSVDNTAILWDLNKGRSNCILSDYKGFVQGVTWDPCNQYVCTLSSDRHCRLIDLNTKKTVQRVTKAKIPTPSGNPLDGKWVRLFYDDTFKSFFRRLTYTPDGTLIIAPSGIIEPQETTDKTANATIVFSRHNLKEPVMILPSSEEQTIAVRCCPLYFHLREDGPTSMIPLPYRMIFAVATHRSVVIYDTQQTSPIAIVSNIHFTRLTDVAWSSDGKILMVSSTDGYCSIIQFQDDELGKIYEKPIESEKIKDTKLDTTPTKTKNSQPFVDIDTNAMDIDIVKKSDTTKKENDTKKIDTVKNNDIKKNESRKNMTNEEKNKTTEIFEETEDIQLIYEDNNTENNVKPTGRQTPTKVELPLVKTPRRVKLITISSPKNKKE
ncbi:chromatin assembly factor 1 subunit B [Leptopilina heterotoma]|uniref:chromatin assembly factor 1 subunit B n=1 Tax=Leptopilina heterotoma TaxID=63436 RepID=UPI001CA915D9|nr:chromatin assembly factor 1 subunit B [Leptopilina heterotoma]XP_043474066.1 chromatin assembly factor 1 subunit B [Leptopilina heterotoma]XP_043474067.1 chromatin assembly factor 1 subunit B [Leptopilina heterotoma]